MAKQVKITDDIHYSSARGLITRNEAIIDGIEVELRPYIEEGTYTYTVSWPDYVIDDGEGGEREVPAEAEWVERI